MKKKIKLYLERRQFCEAFDFASQQSKTPALFEQIVLIAQILAENDKLSLKERDELLKRIADYLVVNKVLDSARQVLLSIQDNLWVMGKEKEIEHLTGHCPSHFDMGQAV